MKTLYSYTIIALLILSLCGAGFASYTVGQPALFDTTVVKQSTGHLQTNPVVAGSNSSFMAVWVDMRDAGNTADLFAAHLSPACTVLDQDNIRLTNHACVVGKPDICWNGQEYFVVYANAVGAAGSQIHAIRLSVDGAVLSQNPILISSYPNARDPQVSWDGTNWVVVWAGDAPNGYSGIYAVRVNSIGAILDPTPIAVSPGVTTWDGTTCASPAVASSAIGDSLIVWSRNPVAAGTSNDLHGVALNGDTGTIASSDTVIYAGTTSQDTPDVCWAGDHFKVVWADGESVGRDIRSIRVSTTCAVLDPEPWTVSSTSQRQFDPRIAWNGSHCIVTWTRKVDASVGTDIYAARLGVEGNSLDGSGFAVCSANGRQAKPGIALMSEETLQNSMLICWTDDRQSIGKSMLGFGTQAVAAIANLAMDVPVIGTEVRLAESASQHKAVCSAYSGQKLLVCWEEWTEAGKTLNGAIADAYTGQPSASTLFTIMPIPESGVKPSLIWNGENFVIFWTADYDLKALRISPTGAVLDSEPVIVIDGTASTGTPTGWSVAVNGDRCLIAYKQNTKYRAAIVSHDLSVLSNVVFYTASYSSSGDNIAACWVGEYYLLAWRQMAAPEGISYTTISATGAPNYTRQIADASKPYQFCLAWNGQTVLLVSQGSEVHSYSGWNSVYRCFGTSPTVPATPLVVAANAAGQENLNLLWDGMDYVLTWTTAKPDTTSVAAMQYDVQFTRINRSNQLVGVNSVNITNTLTSELGLAVCAGPMGRMFVASAGYEDAPFQSARVKGLYVDTLLPLTWLGQVRNLYEGAYVSLSGPVASASFRRDRFYVQNGRAFGIGVKAVRSVAPGDEVSFTGILKNVGGETLIDASVVDVLSSGHLLPEPIGMLARDLGGTAPSPAYSAADGAAGLYNVGMLVKVWGRVTQLGDGCFYIEDGSNVPTDPGHTGLKVYGSLPAGVPGWVTVTGISGCEQSGDKVIRVIRATDVQPLAAQ